MLKCFRYSICMLSFFFWAAGMTLADYNLLLICVLGIWLHNMLYAMENVKSRLVFLIFHCTFFVFLLSRPTISLYRGYNWQYSPSQSNFALGSMGVSLIMMGVGTWFWENYSFNHEKPLKKKKSHSEYMESLRIVSLILYICCIAAYFYSQMDKVIFMLGKDYLAYYTDYVSELPYLVYLLASYMPCALAIYLMTLPPKRQTFWILSSFLLSEIPVLVFGKRGQLMLNALYILVYYLLRDFMEDKEKWIGKFEKIILGISVPSIILLLGIVNYTRSGNEVSLSFGALVEDFFYKQGVSFNVLNIGFAAIPLLPQHKINLYSFGTIVDYITHGTLAQKFFGTSALGTGNNLVKALEGHTFSHNMSYVTRGQDYLDGKGWGSSYLLESYADFGYIGIIVCSFLFGVLFVALMNVIKRQTFGSTIALVCLINLFFTPRAGTTEFLDILLKPRFWVPVLLCYIGAGLLARTYTYRSLQSFNRIHSQKGERNV